MQLKYKTNNITKISFMGAMCTGKTTLYNAYQELFKDNPKVAFVPEAGRWFLETHPGVDRTQTEIQAAIQTFALQHEQEVEKIHPDIIICDNSVLSAAAHVMVFGDTKGAEVLLKEMGFWLPTYSMFFVLNTHDVAYEQDMIRIEDIDFREKLQNAYLEILKKTNVPHKLLKGTVEQRMQTVNEFLGI